MEKSFLELKPKLKHELENQLGNIKKQIETKLKEEEDEESVVDSDKIKAITTMVDEISSITAKNFSVYARYHDFSFTNSRTNEDLTNKLATFFEDHFSGDF